jgi:tetratricopeptide (TPR) repeat protein
VATPAPFVFLTMATKFRNSARPGVANPFAAHALLQQAIGFHQKGQLAEAQRIYEAVLKMQPRNADALHLSGVIASQIKQFERAVEYFDRAIAVNPAGASFYSNRGNALVELGRLEEAVASFDRAIERKADFAEAWSNRSNALRMQGRPQEAVESCDRALALRPDYPEAWSNRGNALRMLKRGDEALEAYEKALALRPDYADVHWNKSLTLLSKGDLLPGWEEFEWGWAAKQRGAVRPEHSKPLWLGKESLEGETILLQQEQGFGDIIQFSRYAILAARQGARVILELPKRLVKFLSGMEGVSEIVATGDPLPDFDFHCPLLSLPLAFQTTLETIPTARRYVPADPEKIRRWERILGPKTKPRIGLTWSGRADNINDWLRSMSFEQMAALLSDEFEWISLQKDVREADVDPLRADPRVRLFGDQQEDFSDAAAMCELMDLIICVDTSIAHVSGAVGRPTWLLLSYFADWRWLDEGDTTAWYPGMRLYRQEKLGDWSAPLTRIRDDLRGKVL